VEAAAGLDKERTRVSRGILSEYGNMSSATVLFTLDRLRAEDAPRPCVALALGPGLVAEAALIL
jgi:predicted naringenin-chalcone synthase